MLRQRLEGLTKSFKGRADYSKEDEENTSRSEVDNKVVKILKLIENDNSDERNDFPKEDSERVSELIKLVQDFHKQYQLLYAHNTHLQEKLKKDFCDRLEDGPLTSSYSSDSEYFSSDEVESHNVLLENELKEVAEASSGRNAEYANTNSVSGTGALKKEEKILSCVYEHESHESQPSAQIKKSEQRMAVLEMELKSLQRQKKELEAIIESKDIVVIELQKENTGLHAQMSELQRTFKQKENEMSSLLRKLEDNEKKLVSKLAKSMGQASNLQLELDSLHAQKSKLEEIMVREDNEASSQIKSLVEQLNSTGKKIGYLVTEKSELESKLDRKTKESLDNLTQIGTMKEELERKTIVLEKTLEDKARFIDLVKDLESEVHSLGKWKYELEQQIQSKIHEASLLKEEKEVLHSRVTTLEMTLTERGQQMSELPQISENKEHEDSSKVMALTAQVQTLQHELDILQAQKSQPQLDIDKEIKELQKCVMNMEGQNSNLIRNVVEQKGMQENEQYPVDKLREENKQSAVRTLKSKINWSPQTAERKMEELAEEFHKKVEDNIRLLCQRIRVAEQLHTENKDNYSKMKSQIKQESQALELRRAIYEDDVRKLKHMLETAKNVLNGLELVMSKFEDSERFMSTIERVVTEIQNAKSWVERTNDEVKQLKDHADSLQEQLDGKEEQEVLLRQKLWNLEAKVSIDKQEYPKTMRGLCQLEMRVEELEGLLRQKNEQLLDLGEEKREAIRQLCLLIEYHQGRYDHLKKAFLRNLNSNS